MPTRMPIIAANGGPVGAIADLTHVHAGLRLASAAITNSPGLAAGLSLSHSERAPSIDELFANGPHGGSQQFLVGDPTSSTSEAMRRAQPAPHDRPGPRPGQRLLQPLLQLHLPGADRRDPGRPAGLRLSPGQGRLLRLRARERRQVRHRRWASTGAASWSPTRSARRSRTSARRRRSRRSACSAR